MMGLMSWLGGCAKGIVAVAPCAKGIVAVAPHDRWPDLVIHKYARDCIQVHVETFCWGMQPTRPQEIVTLNGLTPKERANRIVVIADRLQARVDEWRIHEERHTKKFNDRLTIIQAENAAREQAAARPIHETLSIVKELRREEATNAQAD